MRQQAHLTAQRLVLLVDGTLERRLSLCVVQPSRQCIRLARRQGTMRRDGGVARTTRHHVQRTRVQTLAANQ